MRSHHSPSRGRAARRAACIVKHGYYPDNRHVRRNAEALVAAGWEVHLVCLRRSGQPAREMFNGVTVHRMPIRRRRGSAFRYAWEYGAFALAAMFEVSRIHARRRLAVVEIDNMPDFLALAALPSKLAGARVIHFEMDPVPELWKELRNGRGGLLTRGFELAERTATSLADHVVVTQDLARRRILSFGTPSSNVSVVVNTADEASFVPRRPVRRGKRDDAFVVVTHGTLLQRYGIHVLLDALPELADTVPGAQVEIFGEGEFLPELLGCVRRNGIADQVCFRGFVPDSQLLLALERADAGYVGMLNNLSLPSKLMEFVALEIPVALARWPIFEHHFSDEHVNYFTPGDAASLARTLCDIHADTTAAAGRAKAARERWLARYSWQIQRQHYLDVYELLT